MKFACIQKNIRLPGWTTSPVEASVKKLRFKSAVVNKIGRSCSLQLRMSSTQIFPNPLRLIDLIRLDQVIKIRKRILHGEAKFLCDQGCPEIIRGLRLIFRSQQFQKCKIGLRL